MRLRVLVPAVGLALLLSASATAATPSTGQWARIGPAVPATFEPGGFHDPWNSKVGPDGRLYVFGTFTNAGGDPTADYLAVFDPATGGWSGLGSNGAGDGAFNSDVFDITWFNGLLYAGGGFQNAGGISGASGIAAWNGTSWTKRGSLAVPSGIVYALASSGGTLYAGGAFYDVGGDLTADHVAAFDGFTWHGLGTDGAGGPALNGVVFALQALPDGRVFAGGMFVDAGLSGHADHVAWWDPGTATWNPVGGVAAADGVFHDGGVMDIAVVGSKVYVAGYFTDAANDPLADGVAVWTGAAWTHLGANAAGTDGPFNGTGGAMSLAVYGSNIIVGGYFSEAGGVPAADRVAAWNGSKGLALGTTSIDEVVEGTSVAGRTLFIAGQFNTVGGLPDTQGIAAFGLPAPPSVPQSLAGAAGAKKVALTWAAPATLNGGGPVRDYIVQYRKKGAATWKTFADGVKTTRSAVVTGLLSGTTYDFRVLAKNDWGTGPTSAVITRKAG
ncbi:MAG: fibronectin type III domain-containing protein [Chloroflexota bacterium]